MLFCQFYFLINRQNSMSWAFFHRLSHSRFLSLSRFPETISSNLVCFVLRNTHNNDNFYMCLFLLFLLVFFVASLSVISLPRFFSPSPSSSSSSLLNCITPLAIRMTTATCRGALNKSRVDQ